MRREQDAQDAQDAQEAQEALNTALLQDSGPGLGIPTPSRQNYFNGGQLPEQFDELERQRIAERDQEFDRREHLLAEWALQLEARDRHLGERSALVERTIRELQQQRQTLNRAQQAFETAHDEVAERTVNINIQHQAFRNAGTCKLNNGPARCGRYVFGDYQSDLYTVCGGN